MLLDTPRLKPPNLVLRVAFLILTVAVSWRITDSQRSQEEPEAPIGIIVDSTPYSLAFSINDTEFYTLGNITCRNLRGQEVIANDEHVCENLDPCTTYLATLTIESLSVENPLVLEKNTEKTTDYAKPEVEFLEIDYRVEEIYLTWTSIHQTCISSYQIEVKLAPSSSNVYRASLKASEKELRIDGLDPCQEYNLQLKTYDIKDDFVSNITDNGRTKYAEPGNITGIIIDTSENSHAKISWEPPQHKTCIDVYYIKWFTLDCEQKSRLTSDDIESEDVTTVAPNNTDNDAVDCVWLYPLQDSNAKEHTIKDLHGCETYGLQLYINNKTNARSELEKFTASEELPGIVGEQPIERGATNVTLRWNQPLLNAKCVKHYEVIVSGPLQNEPNEQQTNDTATVDTYAIFDDLEPCGEYEYKVRPVSKNGTKGDEVVLKFETLEAKPTAVRHPVIFPEPHALNITWREPAFAHLCIKEYRLSVWMSGKSPGTSKDATTSDTNTRIDTLIACQSYTVQIIATTILAEDGELSHTETETAAAIANAPDNLQTIGLYSDGLEFSTRSSDPNNACETIFARFYCKPSTLEEGAPRKTAERNVEGKVGGTSFRALLSPLTPFTEYSCTASLYNVAGWSKEKQIIVKTMSYYAETPEEIGVKSRSKSTVAIVWNQPQYPNGNINTYILHFQRVRAEYYVPPKCPPIISNADIQESSVREKLFTGLFPYTRYSIQVAAKNQYGVGEYTRPFMVVTDPDVSEPVTNLKMDVEGPYESDLEYKANVVVSWIAPCKSNGLILSFELKFHGERAGQEHDIQRFVDPEFKDDGSVVYNETTLKPEYSYTVSVRVRTEGVEPSLEQKGAFESPAGIPKRFNETTADKARVTAYDSSNPTNSAIVRFPAYILESESGTIVYTAFLLSEKGCNPKPELQYDALNSREYWPETRKWSDVYKDDSNSECIFQYQTTKKHWTPYVNPDTNEVEYTIGTEKCDDSSDYCNGPLKPDTEFYLVIRLFTISGYNDAIVLEFRTDSLIELTLILVTVSSCLLLAFILGIAYIVIKRRMAWKRQSYHDIEDPFGDILAKNFATYYSEVSKPERITREFKELTMVAMDLSYSASEMGCSKNRYTDIYPYDKNRVILDIDADGSDYINASFIDGYRRKKEYIATQGPKPESTMDFWRMILQHNVRVIVMVTQFREGDTIKCHEYFPYKSNGINVTVKKKDTFELYDRSEMTVTHDRYGLKQKIVHFYFKKWPDHGVPVDPMHLITFVRKVKAERVPNYSSIVVHCSAGVGRTGTFIGLDIIMQRLKSESKINIYGTVKKLRFQRMKMVQSLAQYTFLYTCAYELVKHKSQRNVITHNEQENVKKVSFDAEANIGGSHTFNNVTSKFNGRMPSDLSAIEEIEHENSGETTGGSVSRIRERPPPLKISQSDGPIPMPLNGYRRNVGSLQERTEDDVNANESIM